MRVTVLRWRVFLYNINMDILKDITEKSFNNRQDLQNELAKALGASNIEADEPQGFRTEGVFFGQQPPTINASEYLKASTGWVYGCVTRIANAVASVEIELYKVQGTGDEVEEVENHPALELLDKVNPYTTRFDHLNLTQEYLELTGESPWYIDRGESGKQEPQNIMLLRPDRLTIVANDDKNSTNPIKHYVYKVDAENEITITPDELIFLKYPDPTNQFRGKGTLSAAAKVVDIDNFSEDYNKRFFYNSARPDMVLSSDQKLTSSQRQNLQNSIKKLYQGADKSHKTLILESGLDAKPFSMSPKDMDFLAQQNYDMAKIFSIFGVPKSIMAVSDDVNLANAKVGEYVFMKYTIVPKLKRIVAQLNEFYLPMFAGTENMFFSFDNPIPEDSDATIRKYDSALGKGYMSYNEVRAELNLPDVGDSGDILYIPFSNQPIDMASAPAVPITEGVKTRKVKRLNKTMIANSAGGFNKAVKGLKVVNKRVSAKKESEKAIQRLEAKINTIAKSAVASIVKQKQVVKQKQQADKEALLNQYVATYLSVTGKYERAHKLGTQLIFGEQKKKTLAKFKRKSKATIDVDDYLLDETAEAEGMVRVYTPITKRVIKDGGESAAKLVGAGAEFSMASKPVQNFLEKRLFDFSFEVNQETNRLLKDALIAGVANGDGIPVLRQTVANVFDNMEVYRAERIARSEVIRANNFAATEAYKQNNVTKMEWLATPDDKLDPECASLDGKVIKTGGGFANNDYDGIVEYPPLHPNCRCTVIPVIN